MIKFLGGLINLLGQNPDPTETSGMETFATFIDSVEPHIHTVVIISLAVVALCSVMFGIYVGFRLARAADEGKRRDAKQQMVWTIIAAVAVVAVVLMLQFFFNPDGSGVFTEGDILSEVDPDTGDPIVWETAVILVNMLGKALSSLLKLAATAATLFALYLGIRLATAQDEGKRAQAKAQFFWTVIGCVIAIALAIIIRYVMIEVAKSLAG